MKQPNLLAGLLVLAGSLVIGPAKAEPQEGGPDFTAGAQQIALGEGGREHEKFPPLSDDQLTKLRNLKDAYNVSVAEKRAALKSMHHQKMDLLTSPSIDKGAIVSLSDKMNALHSELAKQKTLYEIDKMQVFTPEQRERMHHHMLMFSAMKGHHRRAMMHQGGPGGRRGFFHHPGGGRPGEGGPGGHSGPPAGNGGEEGDDG